jgi:NAD(P)-dependent dehydrogenase (short-subunit alcohol dehydrogenase family)
VALSGRDVAALEAVRGEVEALGSRALVVPADLRIQTQVEALVNGAAAEFGRLDILVNNGGNIVLKPFVDTTVAQFREQMDLHFIAAVIACKVAVPIMQTHGGGKIINMSSLSGTIGYDHHSAYSPAKGALIRFSEAIAKELKPDLINVNCIAPNAVTTALFDEWIAENDVTLDTSGWIKPEEIGALAVFLCSPAARSITGETIVLQGIYVS